MADRLRSGLLPDRHSSHFQTIRHNSGLLSDRFNSVLLPNLSTSPYDRTSVQENMTTPYNRSQNPQRNPAPVSNMMDSSSYRPRPAATAIDPDDVQARLRKLHNETGYNIVQRHGQRIYGGPPPGWEGEIPGQGTEVYCYRIPRDCFEDELVPVFSKVGPIFELRLIVEFSGTNRTYCFVRYTEKKHATEAIRSLDGYEIRKGHQLAVSKSQEKRRLWIDGTPQNRTVDEFKEELGAITSGITNIVLHPSQTEANRTRLHVEYESHRAAARAKRKLMPAKVLLFGVEVGQVDWAKEEPEVDEQQTKHVKILYVRHLNMATTEETLWTRFNQLSNGQVERVKKIRDFAYVHLTSRESAELVMNRCNTLFIDGQKVEVLWAKPPTEILDRQATFAQPPTAVQNWKPTQILNVVCKSNNWGKPVYKLNWTRDTSTGLALYHYSVIIPQYPAPFPGNVFQSEEWIMSAIGAKTEAAQHVLSLLKLRRPNPSPRSAPGYQLDQSSQHSQSVKEELVTEINGNPSPRSAPGYQPDQSNQHSHSVKEELVPEINGKGDDWKDSLLISMKDPSQIVSETEEIVIILDMYPKAREHYMVLPLEVIRDIYSLTPEHLPLLQTMEAAGFKLTGNNSRDFMMGFHAKPHLNRLHLHVISKDLDSDSLWKKHHWNIFTTPYFISCQTVVEELVEMGKVRKRTEREVSDWRDRQPQCHICSYSHTAVPYQNAAVLSRFPSRTKRDVLGMKVHIKTHFDEQKSTNHLPTKKVPAFVVRNNVRWHRQNLHLTQ